METRKTFFEKEAFLISILIFLPFFSFLSFINDFIFPKGTFLSDYTISHYPNLLYLQNTIQTGQGVPLWNPQIFSGYPTIANPLSGIWYPGNWLTILFPLPFGTHMITVLHLIMGGIGMYLFLRKMELSPFSSFFGAMAFQMMPKLFAHYAAGHISLVQAITFTPWILYLQQIWKKEKNGLWLLFAAALTYSLVILCDIRWVAYLFILDMVVFFYEISKSSKVSLRKFVSLLLLRIAPVLAGILLTAYYLLPFFEYVGLSDRNLMTSSDILNYSLPLGKLIGFIVPDMGGYAEYVVYPGLVIWVTFLGVFTMKKLRRQQWVLLLFAGLFLIYSFGSSFPFLKWIAFVPGINLLRVPSRMFFLISFLMIFLSSLYINAIQFTEEPRKAINLLPQFFTLLFSAAIMSLVIFSGDVLISDFFWPVIISIILFGLFIIRKRTNRFRVFFQLCLVVIFIIDLTVVNSSQYDSYSKSYVSTRDQAVIEAITPIQDEPYRVYSPSYSVEQNLAAENQLELVDGVDPLHLTAYADYMEKASGVEKQGYQVTIPTFANGKRKTDNINAVPNTRLLGLLNVKYIVSAFPVQEGGVNQIMEINGAYVYENMDYLPRAWVERDSQKFTEDVTDMSISANKIVMDVNGPGTLILSEIDYPGWNVTNNGQKLEIAPAYDILRSVQLSEGKNHIIFKFEPYKLYLGFAISGISLLAILISIRFITKKIKEHEFEE